MKTPCIISGLLGVLHFASDELLLLDGMCAAGMLLSFWPIGSHLCRIVVENQTGARTSVSMDSCAGASIARICGRIQAFQAQFKVRSVAGDLKAMYFCGLAHAEIMTRLPRLLTMTCRLPTSWHLSHRHPQHREENSRVQFMRERENNGNAARRHSKTD